MSKITKEEVCEALTQCLKSKVTFDKHYNEFIYFSGINFNEVCSVDLDDLFNRKKYDLITLIGRFYEGLDNNE